MILAAKRAPSEPHVVRLNRPQSLAHQRLTPGNSVALPWGRGTGKSFFFRFVWYELIARWDGVLRENCPNGLRGVRIVHLMPSFKQCKDIHGELADAELNPGADDAGVLAFASTLGAQINHTSWLVRFPGGSRIQWFGTREANAVRGMRCDVVTMDEADDIDPDVVDSIVTPWLSEPWSLKIVLLGGTYRRGRYGLLYREYRAGLDRKPGKCSFHATYLDAPENVDRAHVEKQRAELIENGKEAVFQREWLCDPDSAEGLVYPHFDETLHVRRVDAGKVYTEVLIGVDHGWEDPGVFLAILVYGSGKDAVCHIAEEVYEPHQLEGWWVAKAKALRTKYPRAKWYGDPSRPDRIRAIADGASVHFHEVNNAIEDGVSSVAERMAVRWDPDHPMDKTRRWSKLYIDPRCKWTIWELTHYRRKRDPRNADRFLDDIEDAANHAADAARYCLHSRFGKPKAARGMGTQSLGMM